MRVKQGEIWFADYGEPVGREQGYPRPALIVSNDDFHAAGFGLVIAVPLTTRNRGWTNHIEVPTGATGLRKTSWAMVQQVRSLSPMRFEYRLGQAPTEVVGEVLHVLGQMV
ncbi:type II toxin-antitoxin system PemK/MazF family toxin [Sphaerimonospora thailandensis]|uniref:type II toxin-antitoxin system PemK/MazF family toxin n=1 Tax=Sphaerimonospora thailandensis TaxID=795644 RepID=UPI001951BEC7|nr:type II toxin-antitoxin system PemK/MazF family toxin [Sphaerimonospora thailandensis]